MNNIIAVSYTHLGSVNGPYPTKSRGAGWLNPWKYFISFACLHPAGNCKFKSTPIVFRNFHQQK